MSGQQHVCFYCSKSFDSASGLATHSRACTAMPSELAEKLVAMDKCPKCERAWPVGTAIQRAVHMTACPGKGGEPVEPTGTAGDTEAARERHQAGLAALTLAAKTQAEEEVRAVEANKTAVNNARWVMENETVCNEMAKTVDGWNVILPKIEALLLVTKMHAAYVSDGKLQGEAAVQRLEPIKVAARALLAGRDARSEENTVVSADHGRREGNPGGSGGGLGVTQVAVEKKKLFDVNVGAGLSRDVAAIVTSKDKGAARIGAFADMVPVDLHCVVRQENVLFPGFLSCAADLRVFDGKADPIILETVPWTTIAEAYRPSVRQQLKVGHFTDILSFAPHETSWATLDANGVMIIVSNWVNCVRAAYGLNCPILPDLFALSSRANMNVWIGDLMSELPNKGWPADQVGHGAGVLLLDELQRAWNKWHRKVEPQLEAILIERRTAASAPLVEGVATHALSLTNLPSGSVTPLHVILAEIHFEARSLPTWMTMANDRRFPAATRAAGGQSTEGGREASGGHVNYNGGAKPWNGKGGAGGFKRRQPDTQGPVAEPIVVAEGEKIPQWAVEARLKAMTERLAIRDMIENEPRLTLLRSGSPAGSWCLGFFVRGKCSYYHCKHKHVRGDASTVTVATEAVGVSGAKRAAISPAA